MRTRIFVSVKIFSAVTSACASADRHPRFFAATLFLVVAVVWAVKPSLGPLSLALTATFLFGVGVGRRQRMDAREVTE